jgi:hypothetical protein
VAQQVVVGAMLAMQRHWPRERTNGDKDARGGRAVTETTVTNRPVTWCDVCGGWYEGPEENHWHSIILDWVHHDSETTEQRPIWHKPTITRLDVARTMAWCGSGEEDSHE